MMGVPAVLGLGLVLAVCGVVESATGRRPTAAGCRGVAKYNVTFLGLWARVDFPKQYPLFRPHAQWTKVVGRTHNNGYSLFTAGRPASPALRQFAELGSTALLDADTQGKGGILDTFALPSMGKVAEGVTSGRILLDGRHPRVSLVSRLVPSPDWFVGVDGVALCRRASWLNSFQLDLHPYDAGTDMGYTFTAPNWPEDPLKPVTQITAQRPSHPANSFYYPDLPQLPPIARLEFRKVATYSVKQILEEEEAENAVRAHEDTDSGDVEQGEGDPPTPQTPAQTPAPRRRPSTNSRRWWRQRQQANRDRLAGTTDCQVGNWSDWGPCSKTCGFGKRLRMRRVTQRPRAAGAPCPPLLEDQLCGSMRNCGWNHFSKFNSFGTGEN